MLNLPRKSFAKIKNYLTRQQQKVESELKSVEKEDPVMLDGLAESSEPGTDSWIADVHSRASSAKQNLLDMLAKIKKALMRLKTGNYGKCENCGKQIETDRLEAMPIATLCMACSKKKNKR